MIRLDLRGGGIRGISYDPHLGGYLVISRRPNKSLKLWFWDGDTKHGPKRMLAKGIQDLRQAEGVSPVRFGGRPRGILIVSDDGDGLTGRPGRYLFVGYDSLSIK